LLDVWDRVHIHAHALHHAFLLSGIHAFMHRVSLQQNIHDRS
jgi:hypothetical protein